MPRIIKISIALIICCSFSTLSMAQEKKDNWWRRTWIYKLDQAIGRWYFGAKTDTLYVVRPDTKWILKGVGSICGSSVHLRGNNNGTPFHANLKPSYEEKVSVGVDYVGLHIGVSANPSAWAGKYNDYEFNFTLNSNKFGVDFVYHSQSSAEGWLEYADNRKVYVPSGALHSKIFNANLFYAFNDKKFSIPASSFSQSFLQKRSAGSWLLGMSFMNQIINLGEKAQDVLPINKFRSMNISFGAGYGYNWVLPKNFLFHVSAIPSVIIYNHTKTWDGKQWERTQGHFPDLILMTRASLVHNYKRLVSGITLVGHFSSIGDRSRVETNGSKWRARVHFGWRF